MSEDIDYARVLLGMTADGDGYFSQDDIRRLHLAAVQISALRAKLDAANGRVHYAEGTAQANINRADELQAKLDTAVKALEDIAGYDHAPFSVTVHARTALSSIKEG